MRNEMSYSLAFATNQNDEDSGAWQYFSMVSNPRMRQQLETARNQCKPIEKETKDVKQLSPHVVDEPLPHTLSEALRPTQQAIVITECQAPFKIWNVNRAWEELCGYSFVESRGKTLGKLLKGPETDPIAATNLVAKLLQGEQEVGTTLTNYTKTGRPFRNRIRVGPIYDEDDHDRITHFVGILQEVSDAPHRQTPPSGGASYITGHA
jgi:PAS domain S-box-containing protein